LGLAGGLEKSVPRLDFAGALTEIWKIVNCANKYIEDSKPWNLAKEKKDEELAYTIYTLSEVLRIVAISLYPFMPATAKNIYGQLGLKGDPEKSKISDIKEWGGLKAGTAVSKSKPLFPRIEV